MVDDCIVESVLMMERGVTMSILHRNVYNMESGQNEGELYVTEGDVLDYEEVKSYRGQLNVTDHLGLTDSAQVSGLL